MNIVFYLLLPIGLSVLWIISSPHIFKPIGKLLYKIWDRSINKPKDNLDKEKSNHIRGSYD